MNRENYKKSRNKPKNNSKISRAKSQMLAKPKGINSTATPKLQVLYSTKTEWLTNVIPKLKSQ
jgi:hypothetical protein